MRGDGVQPDWVLLRKRRNNKGLSQAKLAEAARISTRTVSNAENGRRISRAKLQAIAKPLRIAWRRLLEPAVHTDGPPDGLHIVERYDVRYEVCPIPKTPRQVRHGMVERTICCGGRIRVSDEVVISRKNKKTDVFQLRYATMKDGYIGDIETTIINEADRRDVALYEEFGKEIVYGFTPVRGQTYRLVYNVFTSIDKDDCWLHHHLSSQSVYYVRYRKTLDLSAYLKQGYELVGEPCLKLFPQDDTHSALAVKVSDSVKIRPSKGARGIYTWELRSLSKGLIEVRWDVQQRRGRRRVD